MLLHYYAKLNSRFYKSSMGGIDFPPNNKKDGGIKMLVAGVWILAIGLILNFIVGATWND